MSHDGVRCLVFDVDDTLYLEREYVRSGFLMVGRLVEERLGIRDFFTRAWKLYEGGMRGTVFDHALASCGVPADPALISTMVAVYREHAPDIKLLIDARTCLDRLGGRIRMASITDGPSVSQRQKVVALGLPGLLDPVVYTDDLGPGRRKPSPAGFRIVEETVAYSGSACAYVADNPTKDFAGPKSLGWTTVRVRRLGGLHSGIESGPDVDVEVSTLDEMELTLEPIKALHLMDRWAAR